MSTFNKLVAQCAPHLRSRLGIGTRHTAQPRITAGQNLHRSRNDDAFARPGGDADTDLVRQKESNAGSTGVETDGRI